MRTGPLLPTALCPTRFVPQHRSHAAAWSGVTNAPGLSSGNNGLPQFHINTAQQKHPRIAQHRHWTRLVALSGSNGRVCSWWAKPLLGQWGGLWADTEYFYNREQQYEITRGKCLYFLLKAPDVLLEAECRCRGRGRRVLALEMLPLAVVQGQH